MKRFAFASSFENNPAGIGTVSAIEWLPWFRRASPSATLDEHPFQLRIQPLHSRIES